MTTTKTATVPFHKTHPGCWTVAVHCRIQVTCWSYASSTTGCVIILCGGFCCLHLVLCWLLLLLEPIGCLALVLWLLQGLHLWCKKRV